MKDRALILGASGLLGPYLADQFRQSFEVFALARSAGDFCCDIGDTVAMTRIIGDLGPDVIVNAAALTNVDWCEANPEAAFEVNGHAISRLVPGLSRDTRFIQVSTDQVYPDLPGPHEEEDVVESPVNIYGASKRLGEHAALAHPSCLVLRVNFFGPSRTAGRSSLSDTIAKRMRKREAMIFFEDSLFSPLHISTLASIIGECAAKRVMGVYNAGCRAGASKADFARAVCGRLGLSTESARCGRSSEVPLRAPRPADLRMESSRLEAVLGKPLPTLTEEIAKL
ncbi:MAG: SDR family oxidoreductase [Alphaproteobacteria bacterium]|nr:SDR family oxidoreductase [Alphaproteobacteria bacterium]